MKKIFEYIKNVYNRMREKDEVMKIRSGRISYKDGNLNARSCWNMTRYSRFTKDLSIIVEEQIFQIESLIVDKTQFSKHESSLILTISEDNKDILDEIKDHFIKKDFIVFEKEFEEIQEKVLVISWKNVRGY